MKRSVLTGALTLVSVLALSCATSLAREPSRVMKILDGDNDGTVDLAEAQKAGEALFARLEKDNDGTIDRKELGSRLGKKDFSAADPDSDGTLSKDEYLALIEARFKKADPDSEGTLDDTELHSKAGQALLRLIR